MPKPITLSAGYSDGVTVIPNTFFDEDQLCAVI